MSVTGFYRLNDPSNSVKALKEDTIRLRLYPWHWPCILQARLHVGFRHLWSGTPAFCWTPRDAGSSHQNWARPTEFSSCCTDLLELSSSTSALDTD